MSRIFGDIRQIGYVVPDIHSSMEQWVKHGVGPWFFIEKVTTDYFRYRGEDSDLHIAYWTTDFQGLYDRAIDAGYTVLHEGSIGGEQGRFAYLDTEFDQGTVIEISDISGPKGQMFTYIRDVAANWDGTDPIRVMG